MRWWPLPAIALEDLQVSPRKVTAPETCHRLRVFLQKTYKYTNTFMNICISTEETNKRQPKRATLLWRYRWIVFSFFSGSSARARKCSSQVVVPTWKHKHAKNLETFANDDAKHQWRMKYKTVLQIGWFLFCQYLVAISPWHSCRREDCVCDRRGSECSVPPRSNTPWKVSFKKSRPPELFWIFCTQKDCVCGQRGNGSSVPPCSNTP